MAKKRVMTPAQRREVSKRMKQYWAERRKKGQKKGQTTAAILKELGLPVRKGRRKKVRGPLAYKPVGPNRGVAVPQAKLKGSGLGGPNLKVTRKKAPIVKTGPHVVSGEEILKGYQKRKQYAATGAPGMSFAAPPDTEIKPPIPVHVERSRVEDAKADEKVRAILVNTALYDLRAVRAAQCAYMAEEVIVNKPTEAERRILAELTENIRNQERAAAAEIIAGWAKVFEGTVDQDAVFQLRMLIQRVRGPIYRQTRDSMAPGQYIGEEEFVPFRKSVAHQYPAARGEEPTSKLFLAE